MSAPLQSPPADSLRAVLRRIYDSPEYEWEKARDPFGFLRELHAALLEWLQGFQESHPVAYLIFLGVLTVLLLGILVHFGYLVWRSLKPRALSEPEVTQTGGRRRDAAWHLEEARRLAREGHYAEALAHRFTALLLELDAGKALVFHPSKTPAEYVGEAQLDDAGRSTLTGLVGTLYRHLFGGAPCTLDEVQTFDRRASELATHRATG